MDFQEATKIVQQKLTLLSDQILFSQLRRSDELVRNLPGSEHIVLRAWLISEVERRYPAASAAVAQAYIDAEATLEGEGTEVDYVAVLLAAAAREGK